MIQFYKYHALGNDYIVIDPRDSNTNIGPDLVRLLCERHTGIGADGVLFGPFIEAGKIRFRIFNSDGSEAERSGNGIRIFAKYLYDRKIAENSIFDLYTISGSSQVSIIDINKSIIKVCMGSYTAFCSTYEIHEFLISNEIVQVHYIDIGNPHCVVFMNNVDPEKIKKIGFRISNHQSFPKGANVQIVKVLDNNNLQIEIWERGSGYTLASGTSSVAVSCISKKLNLVSSKVTVKMPGGNLIVDFDDSDKVFLTGPVKFISKGEYYIEN